MEPNTLFIALIAASAGCSAGLVAWLLSCSKDSPVQALRLKLRQAGLGYYTLRPAQFIASYAQAMVIGALLGWPYPAIWIRDRIALRRLRKIIAIDV
ncbi:hypothetical protein [Verminephrobacter aporrectodeae]|uniref:hypothetical protein n=1 Tax=Verminephrobacter aporrectodeae TaxID=1110389 RepID=UPI00023768F7|nr:hypothetical protein [Verminephrobacter aporrectodeae]